MPAESTSETLLKRMRHPEDQRAWERFVELYTPLLYYWSCRMGCQAADAADLVQEVLLLLMRKLPEFTYDQQGSFRAWLRTVSLNCWHNRLRQARPSSADSADLASLAVPDAVEQFWQREYLNYLARRALELMQRDFEEKTWRACWGCVAEGKSAATVGRELGLSVGAVYVAKSRVLSRLRQELEGMLE
jgi:RNA polymerase sigma-70 factor (ECF subfamily)